MVEEVTVASIKPAITQLRQEPLPEGTLAYAVTLEYLGGVGAESESLPLKRSVQGPVGVHPLRVSTERGIPSFGKVGPVCHDSPRQFYLFLAVSQAQVERLSKHECNLISVHCSGPLGPG